MTQYDFEKLLEKYLRGDCTPEEESMLDEWAIRQFSAKTNPIPNGELTPVKKRLWKRIQKSALPAYNPFKLQWLSWTKFGIAASIVFVLVWIGSGVYRYYYSPVMRTQRLTEKGFQMVTTAEKSQVVALADGSTVKLQPHSSLTFPERFDDDNRIVYLDGEGFFDIERDTSKPFMVNSGNLVTEVLGTSFTVKSYQQELTAEVIVWSGKVKVYNSKGTGPKAPLGNSSGKSQQPTTLTPNQKVVFKKATSEFNVQIIDHPVPLNPPKTPESFVFEEEPLFLVLDKLARIYGLEIVPSPELKDCVFTGDLNGFELYTQLDWICKSVNAEYEKQGASIVINGAGCL